MRLRREDKTLGLGFLGLSVEATILSQKQMKWTSALNVALVEADDDVRV